MCRALGGSLMLLKTDSSCRCWGQPERSVFDNPGIRLNVSLIAWKYPREEQKYSANHFLRAAVVCSFHWWSGETVAIHHFRAARAWTAFITSHLPKQSWAAESQSLRGKQKITVIERQGKQMSNWYWPVMTHRPLAFPCHFKLVSDLQNRNATPLLPSCHSLMVKADGWAVRRRGLQKHLDH